MRRMHLFELGDQEWVPKSLRDFETDYLAFIERRGGRLLDGFLPPLERVIAAGGGRVVDLCSGGAGPWPALIPRLRARGVTARVTLTDLSPNLHAFARARADEPSIETELAPVDATAVPAHLDGARTIFNGFHHLRPEQARSVLADAARARRPIGIFEMTSRTPMALATAPILSATVLASSLFIRPRHPARLLLTYVVPVLPVAIAFDGLVSALRVYSEDELRELVAGLDAPDYEWEIGSLRLGPLRLPYLLGLPYLPAAAA